MSDKLLIQGSPTHTRGKVRLELNHSFTTYDLLLQTANNGPKTGANWPINVRPFGKRYVA
jgi:hypothetical protein